MNCIIFFVPTNRYGHPHEETLEKLDKIGAQVFRTDESGAIEVRIKGDNVEVLQHGDDWGMEECK